MAYKSDQRILSAYRTQKARLTASAEMGSSRCAVCQGTRAGEPDYESLADSVKAVLDAESNKNLVRALRVLDVWLYMCLC